MACDNNGKGHQANVTIIQARSVHSYYGEGIMKTGSIICLVIFVLAAFVSLMQLWFTWLPAKLFVQILITLGVLFVVVLEITLVKKEYIDDKKMKDSGYID